MIMMMMMMHSFIPTPLHHTTFSQPTNPHFLSHVVVENTCPFPRLMTTSSSRLGNDSLQFVDLPLGAAKGTKLEKEVKMSVKGG